jgi:hypothetical protein
MTEVQAQKLTQPLLKRKYRLRHIDGKVAQCMGWTNLQWRKSVYAHEHGLKFLRGLPPGEMAGWGNEKLVPNFSTDLTTAQRMAFWVISHSSTRHAQYKCFCREIEPVNIFAPGLPLRLALALIFAMTDERIDADDVIFGGSYR